MNTKPLITIGLFIFWAQVVSILTSGLLFYQIQKEKTASAALQKELSDSQQRDNFLAPLNSASGGKESDFSGERLGNNGTLAAQNAITLSLAEISKHSNSQDCWLTIDGKVYDVTSYIPYHPGGPDAITPYCGKDATAAFQNLPHSSKATNLLASYYLGDIGQAGPILSSMPTPPLLSKPATAQKPKAKPSRAPRSDDDDNDDD